jgi:hypothetical protein
MKELGNSSLKLYVDVDGQYWLHIGRLLSLNLSELAEQRGPVWLFQFKRWAKGLTGKVT